MAINVQYTSHTFKGLVIDRELYNHLREALQFEPDAKLFGIADWSFMKWELKMALCLAVVCGLSALLEPFTKNSGFLSAVFLIITIPAVVLLFGIVMRMMFEVRSFLGYKIKANAYHRKLHKSLVETNSYEDFIKAFSKRLR
ncbi:hypothetical protein GCM10027422_06240 [Hymenobacter arcticus]